MASVGHRVRLENFEMHVSESGSGDPVLLLHGWPQHGLMWRDVAARLSESHRVVVPDLRGFGRTDAPEGDYSKHALAGDVLDLMDELQIDQAAIVGHDWGGWIAWLLALEHPERVSRFVAVDIPPPHRRPPIKRLPMQLAFASYQFAIATPVLGRALTGNPAVVRSFIRAGGSDGGRFAPERLDSYARETAKPPSARASVALYRTFLLRELAAIANRTYTERDLRVPGLVVMGGNSAITRCLGVPEPEPQLQVEVMPGVGHFVVDEAPERLLDLLQPFLSQR